VFYIVSANSGADARGQEYTGVGESDIGAYKYGINLYNENYEDTWVFRTPPVIIRPISSILCFAEELSNTFTIFP
jgi:hypothetical protein